MVVGRRLGAYELVAPLATGGMAELFIAKTAGVSGFEKQVALKVIHPNFSSDQDFVRMLIDEAKLAVQLQHANIVQTYDLGVVDGQYYIAMELVDGADLYKMLKSGAEKGLDFPVEVAAFIASEVATGLDYAHRKADPMGRPLQIVHRDVSPQNVLVSYEGEIKIVDFGIAKAALRGQQTQAGVIKGKYFYMSPEQAWGDRIDARTDVFSTGILLHEMLAGEMLYLEEDLDRLLAMVRAADLAPPSTKRGDVPRELDAIVMKALAKRPEDRFQSGADLATALTRFIRTQAPDFGRSRVTRFAREVLDREQSRAEITIPPATRDDFSDENSLIFDLKSQRRVSAKDARREQIVRDPGAETRDISMLSRHHGDYDDGGATEVDPKAILGARREPSTDPDLPVPTRRARPPSGPAGPDFGQVGDDAEPTAFSGGRGGGPRRGEPDRDLGFDSTEDEESTHQRNPPPMPSPPSVPASPSSPPPERPRRTSLPSMPLARGTLPPVAAPPPTPRAAMGLGVSDPQRRSGAQPVVRSDSREREELPRQRPAPDPRGAHAAWPAPFLGGGGASGAAPIADWNAAPTVTPQSGFGSTTGDEVSLRSVRGLAELRKRKILFLAGVVLFVAVVVLTVALVWPEGPGRGSIEVVSSPAGAAVRIDGTVLSKLTPIRISDVDLRQPHRIAVSLRGYDTWEHEAKFEDNERDLRIQAVLIPAVGVLSITTQPPGAEAIVNNRISGKTPVRVGDLPPNDDVSLELRLRGYKVVYKTLQWKGQRALSVNEPLEKAR